MIKLNLPLNGRDQELSSRFQHVINMLPASGTSDLSQARSCSTVDLLSHGGTVAASNGDTAQCSVTTPASRLL